MKKLIRPLLAVILSSIILPTYAVAPGLYLGFMAGPATNDGENEQAQIEGSTATTTVSPRSQQFGARVFLGYKINDYAGVESGITYFSNINYDTRGVDTCADPEVSIFDIDFLGVLSFPIGYFNVFGKGGVAAVHEHSSGSLHPGATATSTCGKSESQWNARATYSFGVGYDLSQNWVAELSWNRVNVGGFVNNMEFYALGFSYHFVDKYCGQFLCDD